MKIKTDTRVRLLCFSMVLSCLLSTSLTTLADDLSDTKDSNTETDGQHRLFIISEIKNDSPLTVSDIEKIRHEIGAVIGTGLDKNVEVILDDCFSREQQDEPCGTGILKSDSIYIVSGSISTFAGSYIVKIQLRRSDQIVAVKKLESQPLAGAAQLLQGAKDIALKLVTVEDSKKEPVQPSVRAARKPAPINRRPLPAPTKENFHSGRPSVRPRIVGHINFWIGLNLVGVGLIMAGTGAGTEEDVIAATVLGGACMIVGMISGGIYRSRVRKWKQKSYYSLITPLVSPHMNGLGYTLIF